ncbi:hypothetical protein [Nannocystis pusilla]|uniref:hypothetical protein n=1 Tax=Nannocystis pusilla TaxID=889268 RepID=UPI003B764BA0
MLLGSEEDRVRVERREHAVDRRVLDLVRRLGVEAQAVLHEREHLLEAVGDARQVGQLGERELAAEVGHGDGGGVAGDCGEELRRVEAEVAQGLGELLAWVDALLVEVLRLHDVGRPHGQREAAAVELQAGGDVDFRCRRLLRRSGGRRGLAGILRGAAAEQNGGETRGEATSDHQR